MSCTVASTAVGAATLGLLILLPPACAQDAGLAAVVPEPLREVVGKVLAAASVQAVPS